MEHLVDLRPARPGYRLHQLELVNWGTFDSSCGHVYRCEPRGRTSLLVGHNGSGKSTLVDAILTLLVDSRTRNYNVAAGAKKTERTARSYIRGAYDRTADETHTSVTKYLRPSGTHLTAIAAVFRDEQLDQAFTLCQVLYLTADGTDDKVFALADEHRDLEHDLAGLQKSDAVRDHLKRLGYKTTKTYVEYQGWLAKRTKIRGKAMDMFNQTVAVKDIQSLNAFIRRHMLEAYDWRDKVQRLLTHFTDLSLAHQELVRARRAEELLSPVETHGREYRQLARELLQLESQLAVSPLFFATQILQLFGPHLAQLEVDFGVALTTISRIQDELKAIQTTIRQLLNEIDQAGGDRLKQIPRLIEIEETRLLHKRDAYSRFHGYLSAAGISRVANSSSELDEIRGELRSLAQSTEREARQFTEQYEEAVGQRGGIHSQLRDEQQELELLEQRRTSLPPRFAAIRSQICQ
ncbi:MAG: hypothetical protein KDA60_03360, partial [Planctomycetales bacterium]|nr:hypothetical protein [Planctomycetales bacterium]